MIIKKEREIKAYVKIDLESWNLNVKDEAIKIAKAFQNNLPMPSPTSLSETAETMLTLSENAQE